MPEQSAGGSLTQRPPQPRPERPAPLAPGAGGAAHSGNGAGAGHGAGWAGAGAGGSGGPAGSGVELDLDARARIAAAVESWRRSLARSELPDTLLASGPQATASWLDLTHAHPSGLAQLFAARPTRLSSLFREPAAHASAVRQARAIRVSAISLSAQRGVHASCLAIGVASWRPAGTTTGPVQAPVVLRACAIRPRAGADDDFDLDLDDGVLINPELVRELVETYGIEADGSYLATLAHGEKGFDPRPVYAWLEERCRSLRAFKIERSLVLATFAAGSGLVLSDLDASVAAISAHWLLGPMAGALPSVLELDAVSALDPHGPAVASLGLTASPGSGPGLQDLPSQPGSGADGGKASGAGQKDDAATGIVARAPGSTGAGDAEDGGPATGVTANPAIGATAGSATARLGAEESAAGGQAASGPSAGGLSLSPPGHAARRGDGPPSGPAAPGESRRLAMVGRLGPRGVRPVRPPAEPDPASELLVLDLDPAQRQAVSAVLRGENVVIEGPPGTGSTHAVAAAIAGLVAAGRRVLVLSPRRASTDSLVLRLAAAGLGELVLDARDSVTGQQATRTASVALSLRSGLDAATGGPLATLPRPGLASADGDVAETLRRTRELLDGGVEALHEVRQPWGVSAYDAMVALSELRARDHGPASNVRLPDATLTTMDAVTRERLRVHLHSAATAGAFTLTRADTRWFDANVATAPQARSALEAALVLRSGLDRARSAMDAICAAAGLRPAADPNGWAPLLDVLLGVRSVVDAMSDQIYDQPLDELAEAVAPRGLRRNDSMSRSDRRRLRRQAQSLVRAGVYVQNLHQVLELAREQLRRWKELTIDGDGPRVVNGLTEADAATSRVLLALDVLVQVFEGTPHPDPRQMPMEDLERRVYDLAGDSQGILGQPRRATLVDGLRQAGLGELVEDLQQRRVGPEQIDGELDLVWWSSIRDSIVRSDPRLSGHDPEVVAKATADLRSAEAAHIAAGAGLVKAAVAARAAKAVAEHSDQVRLLRQELARDDRRPRMIDLVRRCGDVLSAVAPIWVMSPDTVAACLAPAEPDLQPIVDTVVVDDAGHIALPEVVAALARGRQVLIAGDRRRQSVPAESGPSVIGALAPFAKLARLDRDHRTRDGRMMVALAPGYPEGWQLTPGTLTAAPLRLDIVQDGVAVPSPGEELPVSSDAEVRRVLDLVQAHAVGHPTESLAVVTLSERHAERIEEALRAESGDRPALARWLADTWREGREQAFVVRPVQRVLGLERDAVIVSIGLARTPHGRILHRFGALDSPSGASSLITALSRARNRTTVVCCFGAEDLVVDRLRTPGARLLRDVLLSASGRGVSRIGRSSVAADGLVADLRERLTGAGLPVQSRVGDGAWPLDVAISDPRMPGRMLVAVDVDGPAFSSRACREREWHRPLRWERAGWTHLKVSSLDLFGDPAREVERIREAWGRAMAEPMPVTDELPPVRTVLPGASYGSAALGQGPASVWGSSADTPAVQGSQLGAGDEVPSMTVTSAAGPGRTTNEPADDEPVLPDQTRDDTDRGWGESDGSDNRDEELQRERPPHWE